MSKFNFLKQMPLKDLLLNPDSHFILFGGKGGVGKTSCAAAAAVYAADHGKKVLIISTDPAHSLADSLGQKLPPGEVTQIEGVSNLWGMEIKPKLEQPELSRIVDQTGPELGPLLSTMGDMGNMSPPGMDEAMAFGKVLEFLQDTEYDLVIFDTAPTGHTLRLLSLPDMLSGWMGKMLMMRLRLGKLMGGLKSLFGDSPNADTQALDSINHLKDAIDAAKEELADPAKTSFVIVMISELMAIYETERLLSSLIEYEIPVKYFVINQLLPDNSHCNFCANRRQMQQKHLREIRDLYADEFNLIEMPQYSEEIRKIDKLREFASKLCEI
jgi:arsenite-transporting ATPase